MGSLTIDEDNQSKWVWKDGIGGYQNLLDAYRFKTQDDELNDQVIQAFSASMAESSQLPGQTIPPFLSKENIPLDRYGPEDIAFEVYLSTMVGNNETHPASTKYTNDEWYGEIYNFLIFAMHPPTRDRLQQLSLQRKSSDYRLIEGDLFKVVRGVIKRCIVRSEVASVLEAAHDLEGHWKLRLTLKKLNNVFWPNMTKDAADFIAGCLKCGKHGNAQRSQTTSPIIVTEPNELWGVDFVGPFPETILTKDEAFRCSWPQLHDPPVHFERNNHQNIDRILPEGTLRFSHCLVVVDYFSRFV
ncbi:hypothetical protein K3495_g15562 [Podosphaera aphanis]|nr:hypothetical protein K3495_g15562 [Podosphaera aphanis]